MIALLDRPLAADGPNGPVMVLGFADGPVSPLAIYVTDEGRIRYDSIADDAFTADWRYDWRVHEWRDVAFYGEEYAEEESPLDGSEEVSGRVPDVDTTSASDPLDQEERATDGGSGSLDT